MERLLYERVESQEPSIERSSSVDSFRDGLLEEKHSLRPSRKTSLQWGNIVLLAALVLSLAANALLLLFRATLNLDQLCIRHTSISSAPVLQDVNVDYIDVLFNGTFGKQTPFRQSTGPEVDEAWDSLGVSYGPILIPEGKAAEQAGLKKGLLKRSKEQGGGYLVNVEGMHHLHCLNLLRKASHWSYPYYKDLGEGEFKNDEGILFKHYGHCLDIVRQQLMCTVDFSVFGQVFIEKTQKAFPDFMTTHRCRDFEAVRQWAYENQINVELDTSMPVRDGDIILPDIP